MEFDTFRKLAKAWRAQEDWIVKQSWSFFESKVQKFSGTGMSCEVKNMEEKLSDMAE